MVEVGIDEVLEIRQTVFRRHLEQQVGIFGLPREIGCHVVGGDREGEHPALGIALGHHLDVGAVDHVHLGLQLAIGERHILAADHRRLPAQIFRAYPVEGQVGERRLRAPARRHVEVVDQFLDGLPDIGIGQVVLADKRRHVGIERGERLRPGPFVLQRAEKVDDLADRRGHVLGRAGLDLARHAVQPLVEQRAQRPAGTVTGQHVQIVHMNVALAVRDADFRRVDVVEPVVGDHFSGDVENQAAEAVTLIGVGVDAPVHLVEVFVDRAFHVHHGLAVLAQLGVLLAVDDVGAGGLEVVSGDQHLLDRVLDLLDVRRFGAELVDQDLDDLRGQQERFVGIQLAGGGAGPLDRGAYLFRIERRQRVVALDDTLEQRDQIGTIASRLDLRVATCQNRFRHDFLLNYYFVWMVISRILSIPEAGDSPFGESPGFHGFPIYQGFRKPGKTSQSTRCCVWV